jgi:hypothetical protein
MMPSREFNRRNRGRKTDDQGKARAEPVSEGSVATGHTQRAAKHNEIADMLGVASESARSAFTVELSHIADAYHLDLNVVPFYGRPKEQCAAL